MQIGSPLGLLLVLTFSVPNPPIGDPIGSVTWASGNDPDGATHSVGNSISSTAWSAGSMPGVSVSAGDGVGSATWIPGDQV